MIEILIVVAGTCIENFLLEDAPFDDHYGNAAMKARRYSGIELPGAN